MGMTYRSTNGNLRDGWNRETRSCTGNPINRCIYHRYSWYFEGCYLHIYIYSYYAYIQSYIYIPYRSIYQYISYIFILRPWFMKISQLPPLECSNHVGISGAVPARGVICFSGTGVKLLVFHGENSEPLELENQRSDFLNSFCVGDSEVPVFSRFQNVPKYGVGMSWTYLVQKEHTVTIWSAVI